jgi:hypothetical protein
MEDWKDITTYEDALEATKSMSDDLLCDHLGAMCRINVIRRALNKDYNPSFVTGNVYYPFIRFFKNYNDAKNAAKSNSWELCGEIEIEGTSYYLVGGAFYDSNYGLSNFGCGIGSVCACIGLFCCKSEEIAQHMSKYFARDIFEACYSHLGNYKWIE